MKLLGQRFSLRILGVRLIFILGAAIFFAVLWSVLIRLEAPPMARPAIPREVVAERYLYYKSGASNKKVALTFDDGPSAKSTLAIIDTLEAEGVTASFFFIGSEILKNPGIVKEVYDRGFLVGNHSYSHSKSVHSSRERVLQELDSTSYLLERITGEVPLYYRAPYLLGIGTDPTMNPYLPVPNDVQWVLDSGYIPVGIDIDTLDWLFTSTDDIITSIAHAGKNGHIVLMHDDKSSPEELRKIIALFRSQGYTFVTVDELLTPPTNIVLTATMGVGSTDATAGGEVSKLQWFLYKKGYLDPYVEQGVFTVDTAEALAAYQIQTGLYTPSTSASDGLGVTGALTRQAIAVDALSNEPIADAPAVGASALQVYMERGILYTLSALRGLLGVAIFGAFLLLLARLLSLAALALVARRRERILDVTPVTEFPQVSVIVPAWNEEENIAATLRSVINSEYPNLETILVNDGSADRTVLRAEKVAADNPHKNLVIVSQVNQGKAAAINNGIARAAGSIVVVMDGDAIFTPQTVGALAKHFTDPRVAAVSGKVYPVGKPSLLLYMQSLEYLVGQNIDKRGLGVLNAIPVVPGPVGAWRKSEVVRVGGFTNETLVEDQDMTLAMLALGHRVVYEPMALAYTEAPVTVGAFLKQRYRWILGTYQCFGKYVAVALGIRRMPHTRRKVRLNGAFALINIAIFGILLPLTYPIIDATLLYALVTGSWSVVLIPVILFTLVDLLYAVIALWYEKRALGPVITVPFVRILYRQLLLYIVVKSFITWLEGTHVGWMKLKKTGAAQLHFDAATTSAN